MLHSGSELKLNLIKAEEQKKERIASKYLSLIKKHCKELEIKNYELITSGFCSVAIILNDEYVFRFPLKQEFAQEYIREKTILDRVRPHVTVKIPDITIVGNGDELFSMHKIIVGTQYGKLSEEQKQQFSESLTTDIASFLLELHSIKVENSDSIEKFQLKKLPIYKELDAVKEYLKDETKIKSLQKAIDYVEQKDETKDQCNVLSHNDLTEFNILVNPETGKLAGIIDFANSSVHGNYVDFASLHDFYFVDKIAKKYMGLTKLPVDLEYALSIQKIRYANTMLDCLKTGGKEQKLEAFAGWLSDLTKFDSNFVQKVNSTKKTCEEVHVK